MHSFKFCHHASGQTSILSAAKHRTAPLMILFKVFYLVTNSFIASHFWEPFNIEFGITCTFPQTRQRPCEIAIALSKALLSGLNKMYIIQVHYGEHVSIELPFYLSTFAIPFWAYNSCWSGSGLCCHVLDAVIPLSTCRL